MKIILKVLVPLFLVFLTAACSNEQKIPNATDYEVESFTFKNQDNADISLEDLKGKVWVADFVFTNCTTVCLPMTANMKKLQERLVEEGVEDVQLISFSVDPEIDKPEVLREYGEKFNADFSNWHFLTGYSQDKIESFSLDSFKVIVQKPEGNDQVTHSVSFSLVDQEGRVVQSYSGLADIPMDDIIKHIKMLQS
ncbi:SCO family protein [Pradoshia sp.]